MPWAVGLRDIDKDLLERAHKTLGKSAKELKELLQQDWNKALRKSLEKLSTLMENEVQKKSRKP